MILTSTGAFEQQGGVTPSCGGCQEYDANLTGGASERDVCMTATVDSLYICESSPGEPSIGDTVYTSVGCYDVLVGGSDFYYVINTGDSNDYAVQVNNSGEILDVSIC